jgi:alginate O-acetyltransferase complex protein AlgI
LFYGLLIGLERTVYGSALAKLPRMLQHAYGLLIAGFGWVLFRSSTFAQARDILSALFPSRSRPLTDSWSEFIIQENWIYLLIGIAISAGIARPFMKNLEFNLIETGTQWNVIRSISWTALVLALLIVTTAFMITVKYVPFIYFRF